MNDSDRLKSIGARLQTVFARGAPWRPPNEHRSIIFQKVYWEWNAHFLATCETITNAHTQLTIWYHQEGTQLQLKDKLLTLSIDSIERCTDAIEANTLKRFLTSVSIVAESAADIFGLAPLTAAFNIKSALEKIKDTIYLRHPFSEIDESLPLVGQSMEQMLLMALWLDSQVAAVIKNVTFDRKVPQYSVEQLKKPIIERLAKFRRLQFAEAKISTQGIGFPEEGLWPEGLRFGA